MNENFFSKLNLIYLGLQSRIQSKNIGMQKTYKFRNKHLIAYVTFLSSSLRSKAHFCLHCSQVTGGPYLRSELVHRWHLLPMKAAMMLQYSQAVGFPYCFTFTSHFLHIVLVLILLENCSKFKLCWHGDKSNFTTIFNKITVKSNIVWW